MIKERLFVAFLMVMLITMVDTPAGIANSQNPHSRTDLLTSNHDHPGGTVLFSDDFSDGNADGWTPFFDGSWFVEDNKYVVDVRGGENLRAISLAGDPTWTDYSFDVDIQAIEGGSKIVLFRYTTEENYYSIGIIAVEFAEYYKVNLVAVKNGVGTTALNIDYPHDNFDLHHLTVIVKGDHITGIVDGDWVIDYVDTGTDVLSGRIGLQGFTGSLGGPNRVAFDNVVVKSLASLYLPVILR